MHLRRWSLAGVAVSLLATVIATSARAQQGDQDRTVVSWIDRHAVALASTDPADPLDDLRPLRHMVGPATVVGLGESTHGSHEQFRIKHRMVRFLVERMGVRTVGLEDDIAGGVLLDRYVTTGQGDPRRLVADMAYAVPGGSQEILDLVRWMRAYNQTHRDQALVRLGLKVLLEAENDVVLVGEAEDGRAAVDLARRERPDVVLMDIRMPVMDGIDALRAIVADPALRDTRVIMLTTFELDEYVFESLRSGASGFLIKDSEPAELQ